MKLGIMGRLFPAAFGKVVYDYTVKALPDLDIREFKKKQKKEYKAMVARTPSVGSMKENMFAPVMYLACFGFSYYKADPEHITMDVFDGMIDALCKSAMGRAWPNLEEHPFPGFGHGEIMAHPELMAKEIQKFMGTDL